MKLGAGLPAVIVFVFGAVLLAPSVVQAAEGCSEVQEVTAGCPNVSGSVGDDDVTLIGDSRGPGSGGGGGGGSEVGGDDSGGADEPCERFLVGQYVRCLRDGPDRPGPPGPDTATPPVTLADIARFRPDPGRNLMEPEGWMIVGLDTNFYSIAGVQIHDGTLLGQPASVRFTPVQWRWAYGDGASARHGTPGSTWAGQGILEFDPTPTSHVYRTPGTYVITLTIDFRAAYRFNGQSWTPISGILAVPANELVATVGDAKTVLVEQDCAQNPGGPGC